MTREELLQILNQHDRDQRRTWIRHFGYCLTVAARAGYPVQQTEGSIRHLMGFNEIQHQLYQYAGHFEAGTDWGLENFLNSLKCMAAFYGVEGDFWAGVKSSLPVIS